MDDLSAVAAAFAEPHDYVEFPYGRLARWSFGEGPNLVFIHGWPLHGATFRRVIPHLAEEFTCHVVDLPGTGHTTWDAGAPFGLWEHARTVKEALDAMDVDEFALFAHDSGGTIARLLMTMAPDRATALVMGNTEIPGHALPGLKAAKIGAKLPGAVGFMKFVTKLRPVVERMFDGCFADLSQIDTDFGELFIEPFTRDRDYVRGQLRLIEHIDWDVVVNELADVHRQITAPVQLVWGDRDPWFPWKYARAMIDSFGGDPAEVHLIESGKLFVHEEFPQEFAEVAADFLRRSIG